MVEQLLKTKKENFVNKKILYICPNGYLGGAEKFVYTAVKGHLRRGDKVEILFFKEGQLVDRCREESIPYSVLKTQFKLTNIILLFKAVRELRKYIVENDFEIVHATMPYAHIVSSLALVGTSIKRVWFQHGPVGGSLDKVANLFSVDLIFFNSTFLRDQHNQMLFSFRFLRRQTIINLGIDKGETSQNRVNEIREKYLGPLLKPLKDQSDKQPQLWILPGRITRWKGQHLLIEAVSKLVQKSVFNNFAKILIIGEAKQDIDKIYEKELKEKISLNKLETIIELVGHKPDIHNFFEASDVTFHCSTVPEPFGLVAGEAMLGHSLVMGSSSGGITDILKDKVTGLTYDSVGENAEADLASLIEQYMQGHINESSLKEEAYQLIQKNYSVEQMIDNLNKSYEKLFLN
jgi:glycosyltransferase involved in cell wall biosynthesis